MLSTSALDIATLPFAAHLPHKITIFGGTRGSRRGPSEPKMGPSGPFTLLNKNLYEHGNGKRNEGCELQSLEPSPR